MEGDGAEIRLLRERMHAVSNKVLGLEFRVKRVEDRCDGFDDDAEEREARPWSLTARLIVVVSMLCGVGSLILQVAGHA